MQKRGQVTLFIILGILFVALIAGVAYFKGAVLKEKVLGTSNLATLPEDVQDLRSELESCYEQTINEAVELLAIQGGFIFPPANSLDIGEDIFSLAYDGRIQVPALEVMEQELAEYVDLLFPLCPEYDAYENFELDAGDSKTIVKLKDETHFETQYVVVIKKGEEIFRLTNPYESEVQMNFNKMRETMLTIAEEDVTQIDPEFLVTLELPIEVIPYDETTVVYFVEDLESQLSTTGGSVTYAFGTRQ